MKIAAIVLGVLLLFGLIVGGKIVGTRNELVVQREAVTAAWSQVDVVLQRRADLIPNLVSTVQGYAKQEKDVFTAIANARSALIGARNPQEKIAANGQLDGALSRLLVITENYPQLKSDQNFRDLQAQLESTENRITVARNRYIEAVRAYNTTIRQFPVNLTAKMFGAEVKPNFTVENEAAISKPPTVDFGAPAKSTN